MKTKISHLGRSTVSVILAVMMILSTMLVGTVSTVNAATKNKFTKGETIYLDLSSFTDWEQDNPTMYAYFYYFDTHDSVSGKIPATKVTDHIYSVTVPNAYCGYIKFQRGDSNMTAEHDVDSKGSNNCVKVKGLDNNSEWSTYSATDSATYRIGGRFNDKWHNPSDNDPQFVEDESTSGLFYCKTGLTIAQLSGTITETYDGKQKDCPKYFYIYKKETNKTTNYLTTRDYVGHDFQKNTFDNQLTLKNQNGTEEKRLVRFNNVNDTSTTPVTIWLDTRNNENNEYKLWYTTALPHTTPVAESVSLKALPETVTSGGSTTLTATLTGKADTDVTLTLTGGDIPQTATVKGSDTTATFTVSPTSTTTYTVTASAENFSSKSAKATVSVTVPDTYYLWTSESDNVTDANAWTSTELTYSNGSYVGNVIFSKNDQNYFFTINKSSNSVTESSIWSSDNEVRENLSSTETSDFTSDIGAQDNNSCHLARVAFKNENTDVKFTFTPEKTVVISRNSSTPVGDVTINVTNVENAIVKAKLGTVTADEGGSLTVAKGSTFEVTVTPDDGYEIAGITYNGNTQTTSPATFTAAVSGDITVTVNKPTEATLFKVAYGSKGTLMRMNKTKYDGIYLSTATIDKDTNFTIFNTAESTYGVIKEKDTYYIKDGATSTTINSWKQSYTPNSGCARNAYGKAKYVVYNANTRTITLTDDPDYGTKATLYVKNGTYSTSFKTGDTKDYAGSSVAAGLATTKTDPCNTYSVDLDTNVNIQTTLNDKYKKAGYYVAAYSVNGRNYPASAKNADQGIYQANITITEDLAENGVVEVTPIYYNRTIEKDDNYITFYVDAERLVGGWGSTVAIYAYAYEGGIAKYDNGKVTNNINLLGAYPGQPMVKDGQYYVAKIPRYSYKISSDGSLVIDKTSPVAGITLNNYYNETVHKSLVPIKRNMQTYDFSDFVALAKKKDVKTIMFQSKFYNATGDAKRNTKVIYGYDTEISDPTKVVQSIPNIAGANVNPYEDFTDYYGRATDLIGNILDDNQKADENNLYVISTGSYDSSKSTSGYSTKGQWVTIWNVYDHNGDLITYGTPANFLDETTEQYKKIAENYSGKPVKISYEKGLVYGQNKDTSRTDGRWYYSTLGQEFTSDVAIEYKDKDDTYKLDTNTNTANTGFIGQTSGATATINNVTTASFTSVTDNARLSINVANGWRFDGWFIKQDDKYTEVSDNYTDISTDVLMSNSYHIVARVSKIPTGTLELNHTAYTGPESHSGTGFYYISAVLKKEGGSEIKFDETQGKISIDKFAATDSLEITLRAKCHGDNTVYALYKGEAGGYTEIGTGLNGKSEFTYTVTVSAGSLFENGKLAVNALNYYTDIVKVGGTCDITYMYKDRFGVEGEGKMVSYVVRNVELSSEEIQDNYQPSDETITKYAPRIDTMYLETKWNLTDTEKVKKGRSQATVTATQTDKTCDVYYPNKDGEYYTDSMNIKTVDYNTLFKDENGNFILSAPETDKSGKQFSYWDVYKADKNGGNTGELVTKCYERNFGLRIMADYYIEPVYGVGAPTLTANINAPVLNREIYGDSANPKDKLYVDLLTAFTSSDIPTFKENTTKLSVECGVFVVRNNTKTLSETDRNILVQEALDKNGVDTTSTILESYKRTTNTENSVVNKLVDLAVDPNVKDKSNTFDTFDNEQYRITKFIFDNDTLTNKNRIDEVLKYTNNTANQNYIFSAYAFVVIKYSDGRVKEKKISDPQYFNLCYVGNKALDNN